MPCADDRRYEDNPELQLVTRIACDMAKVLTLGGRFDDLLPSTKDWIRKHNEEDARRKAVEMARQAEASLRIELLARLTPRERRILGLE